MPNPKPDFSTPLLCIRWTLAIVRATGEPATLRDAKRLLNPRRDTGLEFESLLDELWKSGEVRQFRDPARIGKPGRPTAYLHPRVEYRFDLTKDLRIHPTRTTESATLAIKYEELKELLYTPPAPESAPAESSVEDRDDSEQETDPQPELETPEPPTPTPPDDSESDSSVPDDTQSPAPLSPDPDPTPEYDLETPFIILRSLAAKSLRERGYGVTDDELLWVLQKKGYEGSHGEELVRRFTTGPEHFMAGGLYLTEPRSPHNHTPQPRYIPRTDGQAKSLEDAQFESLRRSKLQGEQTDQT